MDAYQQSQMYMNMRPPQPPLTPSPSDPHHHHYQQFQPQRPQAPWFPNQFQYHPSQSPSPPPQWPPPHSDHLPPPPYPPPPPNPYPTHPPVHHNQFPPPPPPPPRPHLPPPPPPPPPHSQVPQSYPQANQEWGTSNWGPQQSYNYPAHSNEEDWAARARAWADAKTARENQHSQSQFTPAGRMEDQSHYYDQYPQSVDSHYSDVQNQSHPASSYQQFPVSDAHMPYNVRDGTLAGDSSAMFLQQGNMPTSSSVHQQEVPSSYSSITGKEDTADQNQQSYKLLPLPNSSAQEGQHHVHPLPAPFMYGNQSADSTVNPADQPLDFAPRFNHDYDSHMQSSYAHHDSVGPVRGVDPVAAGQLNNWTPPVTPGLVYPSISPDIASGAQHDPSIAIHSSISAHAAPPFGRFPGPGQPTIPSGGAPFALSAGTALHPTTAFSADAYGISTIPERPKKPSVPNWIKEEIKKAVITTSVDHLKEETQSNEDEGIDKSFGKADQADSKSVDSSRSTEEDDDDEDYVEAARTAAINQEIKRVLTEVLLKVTDELFDEIATKVLSEDDLTADVDQNTVTSNHKVLPSSHPAVPVPKPSGKVLIPTQAKESDTKSVGEKSSTSSPGNILGLANYASDDDDGDDEIKSSSVPNSNPVLHQSSIEKLSEVAHGAAENGISKVELKEDNRSQKTKESGVGKTSSMEFKSNNGDTISEMNNNRVDRDMGHSYSSKVVSEDTDDGINVSGKMLDGAHSSRLKNTAGVMESDHPGEYLNVKRASKDDPRHSETRRKLDKSDRHESKKSSGKDGSKIRADANGDERRRQDERHSRREKADDGSKERKKDQSSKPGEKVKESESRKRSDRLEVKDDRKETERLHRASAKEDTKRKQEHRKDEEEDRSRHKNASESSRHKRRRSSSISSKGRNSKDNLVSHANDSSDDASDNSKRKLQSRKRNLSPSPVRSRRRQVSRSPHSKHSQRRHSPYSSLDDTRGRRSRSRSPVRRHR